MDAEEQSQVAGALVGHSAADFKEGESVVLTLADQAVIEEEGNSYSLNDKEEMLENVNMVSRGRPRSQANATSSRPPRPVGPAKRPRAPHLPARAPWRGADARAYRRASGGGVAPQARARAGDDGQVQPVRREQEHPWQV